VPIFESGREAKEYLVGRIVEEARREGVPLSEIETKMLYFSETAWTLPDIMDVNEAFERDYESVSYEEKIAGLIRGLGAEDRKRDLNQRERWGEAVRLLSREDHYLLVLIGVAEGMIKPTGIGYPKPSWSRFLKLIWLGIGIFLVFCAFFAAYLGLKYLFSQR
jgi:hypothetical protein